MVAKLINRGNGAGMDRRGLQGEEEIEGRGVKLQNGAFSFTSSLVLVSVGKHD